MKKKILKSIGLILGVLVLIVVGYVIHVFTSYYRIENKINIELYLGNEIYLCRDGLSPDTYERGEKFPHFILLAKDKEGHAQLRELSSRAWKHSFTMFLTRVPTYYSDIEEIIGKNPGHIVAASACIGGWLGICYNNKHQKKGCLKWLQEYKN